MTVAESVVLGWLLLSLLVLLLVWTASHSGR